MPMSVHQPSRPAPRLLQVPSEDCETVRIQVPALGQGASQAALLAELDNILGEDDERTKRVDLSGLARLVRCDGTSSPPPDGTKTATPSPAQALGLAGSAAGLPAVPRQSMTRPVPALPIPGPPSGLDSVQACATEAPGTAAVALVGTPQGPHSAPRPEPSEVVTVTEGPTTTTGQGPQPTSACEDQTTVVRRRRPPGLGVAVRLGWFALGVAAAELAEPWIGGCRAELSDLVVQTARLLF